MMSPGNLRPSWVPAGAIGAYHFVSNLRWGNVTGLTEGRSNTGWDTPGGVLTSYGANVARRSSLGLRIEAAATNGNRNSAAGGSSNGTPGTPPTNWVVSGFAGAGLSSEIVSSGTDANNFSYVEIRGYGTASATSACNMFFEGTTQIAASPSEQWTSSAYIALVAGSLSGLGAGSSGLRLSQIWRNSGGTPLSGTVTTLLSGLIGASLTRQSVSGTSVASTAYLNAGVLFNPASAGSVIDLTLRLAVPQTEQAAAMTTPIITTSAAVTRNADAPKILVPDGTYTVIVRDSGGSQQFNGQVAAGGTGLALTPRTGQTLITQAEVYP
jgi:hypothetical protein